MGFKLGDIVHDARVARRQSDVEAAPDAARTADERPTFDDGEPDEAPQTDPPAA